MLTKDLGRFHVTSGAITAVDPAYVIVEDSNCAVTFKAKNGIWLATVEEIPENTWTRVTDVTVRHVDYPKDTPDVLIEGEVGVDTASAGFFDAGFFDDEEVFENIDQILLRWRRFRLPQARRHLRIGLWRRWLSVLRQLGRRRCRRCSNCFHY